MKRVRTQAVPAFGCNHQPEDRAAKRGLLMGPNLRTGWQWTIDRGGREPPGTCLFTFNPNGPWLASSLQKTRFPQTRNSSKFDALRTVYHLRTERQHE